MTRSGISESQSRAVYDRETPYSEAHRNSYTLKMERTQPPRLRELVRMLRKAYADEVPSRIHSRDTDAGGDPAWSPEFTRYLTGSDWATDKDDDTYTTPVRACYSAMSRSSSEGTRRRAAIVFRVVVAGTDPAEAAMIEGAPEWDASACARRALELFWTRLSDVRLDLRKTETAA